MLFHIEEQFLIVEVIGGQFLVGVAVLIGGEEGDLLEDATHLGVGDLLGRGRRGRGGLVRVELLVVVVAESADPGGDEAVQLVFVGGVGSRILKGDSTSWRSRTVCSS